MSIDYTGQLGELAPGAANPEVAVNDIVSNIEQALNAVQGAALPEPTTVGQVLALIDDAGSPVPAWADAPESLPAGGVAGDYLVRTSSGAGWTAAAGGATGDKGPTGDKGATGDTGAKGATGDAGGGGSRWDFAPPLAAAFPDVTTINRAGTVTLIDDADVGLRLSIPSITGDYPAAALMAVPASGSWEAIARVLPNEFNVNYHCVGMALHAPTTPNAFIFGHDMGASGQGINLNKYRRDGSGFDGVFQSFANFGNLEWFRIVYDSVAFVYRLYNSRDGKSWAFFGILDQASLGNGPLTKIGFGFGCNYQRSGYNFQISVPYFWKSWS